MIELTWEDFVTRYEPIKQSNRKGIIGYLLNIKLQDEVLDKEGKRSTQGKVNFDKALLTYAMYVWSMGEDGKLRNGKKFHNTTAYVICKLPHYTDEEIFINLSKQPKKKK
jgi:hypothetical protein